MTVSQPVEPESDWSLEEERALFEMANLYPRDTGLPMTVWIGPKGMARHDARVKVCRRHGERMDMRDTASVAIQPEPRVVAGDLDAADFKVVAEWIDLNSDVLLGYWDGRLSTLEMARGLRSL